MIEGLKPWYNRALMPVVRLFALMRLGPNQLTVLGLFLFCVCGVLLASGHWYWAALVGTAGGFMDGCDGLLARHTGRITRFGGIFDSTCDRLTEIAALTGLAVFYVRTPDPAAVLLTFGSLSGSFMVSYVKARAEASGVPCKEGLLQRPERLIVIGLCALAGPAVMKWALGLLTLLTFSTAAQRLLRVRRQCSRPAEDPDPRD